MLLPVTKSVVPHNTTHTNSTYTGNVMYDPATPQALNSAVQPTSAVQWPLSFR